MKIFDGVFLEKLYGSDAEYCLLTSLILPYLHSIQKSAWRSKKWDHAEALFHAGLLMLIKLCAFHSLMVVAVVTATISKVLKSVRELAKSSPVVSAALPLELVLFD